MQKGLYQVEFDIFNIKTKDKESEEVINGRLQKQKQDKDRMLDVYK